MENMLKQYTNLDLNKNSSMMIEKVDKLNEKIADKKLTDNEIIEQVKQQLILVNQQITQQQEEMNTMVNDYEVKI